MYINNQVHSVEQAFHQKRVQNEMQRFYTKEQNRLMGLQETPKITKRLVEEYIAYSLGAVVPLKMIQVSDTPTSDTWRHACYNTGINGLPVRLIYLYGVEIKFIACEKCLSVIYTHETPVV